MGDAMMDFLFASQDASTASLTWAVHYLSERRDIFDRILAEQRAVRPNNEPLTHELLEQMTYARCLVKVREVAAAAVVACGGELRALQ
jgi:cytochrome P450 family 710 subfamily A protein